jgi:hypothetical protein
MRHRGFVLLWCALLAGCQFTTPPQTSQAQMSPGAPGADGPSPAPAGEAPPSPPSSRQKAQDYATGALTIISLPVLLPLMLLRQLWDPIKC